MNNIEESTKLGKEVRWAVIGRAIADGVELQRWVSEAAILRRQEQDSACRETQFAALARQVGDAVRSGADLAPLLDSLRALRKHELR
jgi:hypothetical protein